jgi:AraC-like DNA-binding protein
MAPVAAPLTPYVASRTAYDVDLGGPGVHRGLPSTTVTFVLPVDEPLDVSWADAPGSRRRAWSSVSGLDTRPAQIRHGGHQRGLQLSLTIAGARALLGVPASALAGELLDLTEVAPGLADLPERLATERDPRRWAELVERRLTAVLARSRINGRAEVGRALACLTRGAGVQEVADEVGYSRRHLSALVRAECGLAPQQLRRIGRFETSRALMGRRPLVEVAHVSGYADQAHLTREWVALAGCSPTTWLREEFPFVQDGGADHA